jgi:serine/threonine-protein kinase RsbW
MNVLQMSIPPLPRFAATARSALSKFACDNAIAPPDLENLIFALGEAIANAIQHARTTEAIEIRIDVDGDSIVVTVTDRGRGIPVLPRGPVSFPSVFAEAGRGFAIMQRCTHFLDVTSAPETGTIVKLGRYRRTPQDLGTAS